jgi:membrane-associated phospholipid phosphatase
MNSVNSINKNSILSSKDGLSIYNTQNPNLSYSPAQPIQGFLRNSKMSGDGRGEADVTESKKAMNATHGRNAEIPKNETLYIVAQYISNTVSIMYLSVFISLLVLRDRKWFYILLIVFVVNILVTLLKIFLIRFDYGFLHRPGKCIDESMTYDILESNFILEGIKNKVNSEDYNMMGFPSMHSTRATAILALTYLFFPKYKKTTMIVAPIYLAFLAWSRMYLDCHTLLQVIAGIIFGAVAAKVSFTPLKI